MFSAIVPKTSKIIRKSPSFHDFLSEMLLRKCFSGHVKSSFDNPAKNFPVKIQVFLVKLQKRRKTNCSRVFFRSLYSLHLDYCFDTPDHFFAKIRKKLTQSPKRDDNSTNYFSHFFWKFCWGHFNEPYQRFFFAIRRLLSIRFRKRSKNYSLVFSPEKTLKRTAAPARRLQFQESWQKNSRQKSNNFAQRPKSLSRVSSIQRNFLKLFLWTFWM